MSFFNDSLIAIESMMMSQNRYPYVPLQRIDDRRKDLTLVPFVAIIRSINNQAHNLEKFNLSSGNDVCDM